MTERIWPSWEGCFALAPAPRPGESWRLASWWIMLGQRVELLFGWVFRPATTSLRLDQWAMQHSPSKPRVLRLLLDARYETIGGLLNRLSKGQTLGDAACGVGLRAVDPKLAAASLGRVVIDRKAPPRGETPDFVAAPWRLIPSRDSFAKGILSPVGDLPSMRAALVRIDKSRVLPDSEDEARAVLAYLARETGLSFSPGPDRGGDLARLGDLELLTVEDAPEKSVQVEISASADAIEVKLKPGLVPATSEAFVRCRQDHAKATLADQMICCPPAEDAEIRSVRFSSSPIGPSGAHVEVWVREGDGASMRLVYEHGAAFIRQIRTNMQLLGTRIDLQADWLERWSRQRRETKGNRARVDAMRAVNRLIFNDLSVVGAPDELWATAETSAKELALRLAPAASGGLWISEGKDKLRVWEWFRSTFDDARDPGSLIIVDPYFDTLGLDIVARLNSTTRSVVAVTTVPNKGEEAEAKKTRLKNLHGELGVVFEDIDFSLYLVGPNRLHDRLVLELDRGADDTQIPRRGFHLSNSLQSATDRRPLLITPIPADLLPDVADGVAAMVEGLQPFLTRPKKKLHSPRSGPSPTIEERARSEEAVLVAARDEDASRFTDAISQLTELLCHVPGNFPTFAREFVDRHDEASGVAPLIEQMLREHQVKPSTVERAQELVGLAQAAERQFYSFSEATRTWSHGNWYPSGYPLLSFGTHLLFECSGAAFCRVWSEWCSPPESGRTYASDLEQGRRLVTIMEVLQVGLLTSGHDQTSARLREVFECGLEASNDFIRAHLAALLGLLLAPRLRGESVPASWPADVGHSLISKLLDPTERVTSIASWVSDLRVTGNQSGAVEPEAITEARKRYFEWMIESWPDTMEKDKLAAIIQRCEGPGRTGTWADTTINDLLLPLVEHGKLSGASIIDYWLNEQEQRLKQLLSDRYHFYGGSDIRLADVYAWILATSSAEHAAIDAKDRSAIESRIDESLSRLDDIADQARRALERPFSRTLAYQTWSAATTTLRWLFGIELSTLRHRTVASEIEARVRRWHLELDPDTLDAGDPTRLTPWLQHLLRTYEFKEDKPQEGDESDSA